MDYKEKLEEAKRLYESANAGQKYVLESLFPELKESEDEKIRKWILVELHLLYHQAAGDKEREEDLIKATSWLEKQGEQKQRYIWKPSDAQMASITCAVRKMKESACYDSELVSLLNDLKKLKK